MQTRAKKKLYNILMAAVILLIIASGIMVTGHLKGWFGGGSASGAGGDAALVCSKATGVVQVERSGVGYTLKDNTVMQDGDIVATKSGSEAVLTWQDADTIALNEKTELTITSLEYRYNIKQIPIQYRDRPAGSSSKLNTISDGFKVLLTLFDMAKDYRPLWFFSIIALIVFVFAANVWYICVTGNISW